jgi:hypothetical protein
MPDIVLRLYLTLMRLTDLTMVKTAKKERKISKTLYYVEGMDMSLGQLEGHRMGRAGRRKRVLCKFFDSYYLLWSR